MLIGLCLGWRSLKVTNLTPLSPHPQAEIKPHLSGNGQMLAFETVRTGTSITDLCLLNLNNGERKILGRERNDSSMQASFDFSGQWLTFASLASNWIEDDDNNVSDIFLYDLKNNYLKRILPPNPTPGLSASYHPRISSDATKIAFISYGVPDANTTRGRNVCLWHQGSKAYSIVDGFRGRGPVLGPPSLSPSGNHVAFSCFTFDLMPAPPASIQYDIYLMAASTQAAWPPAEAQTWTLPALRPLWPVSLLSLAPSDRSANASSYQPVLLNNECIFTSLASNLVANDNNRCHDIFVRQLSGDGNISCLTLGGNDSSFEPCATPDGRWLAFTTYATNLIPNTPTGSKVLLLDRHSHKLSLIGPGHSPTISDDGRRIVLINQGHPWLWTDSRGLESL